MAFPDRASNLQTSGLDRNHRIDRARRYLAALPLKEKRAILYGSVARGDFIQESDTDLLVISDEMPTDIFERMALLGRGRLEYPEVEAIAWSEVDYAKRVKAGDPFIEILQREGIELKNGKMNFEGENQNEATPHNVPQLRDRGDGAF